MSFNRGMTQIGHIATLRPLVIGVVTTALTVGIHAVPLSATVDIIRRERKLGMLGRGFWIDMQIVGRAIMYALVAHLVEIAMWAVVFVLCGEFSDFGVAFYHSAVNYTSLGYGDLVMTPAWRLLGPLETANGMLMFGVSTAMIFAVIQRLVEARFVDLRN